MTCSIRFDNERARQSGEQHVRVGMQLSSLDNDMKQPSYQYDNIGHLVECARWHGDDATNRQTTGGEKSI